MTDAADDSPAEAHYARLIALGLSPAAAQLIANLYALKAQRVAETKGKEHHDV